MADCLFCKMITGEISCFKIAENNNFIAILDKFPVNQGHALVIPKKHCANLNEFPTELGEEWFKFMDEVSQKIMRGVKADGYNIGMNNGKAAHQLVFHQHTHIIPRFSNDGLKHWPNKEITDEGLAELAKKIK